MTENHSRFKQLQPLMRICLIAKSLGVLDEFGGENQGLIVAEVELEEEGQAIALPEWIGQEVSGDPRYLNSNLVQFPYKQWQA